MPVCRNCSRRVTDNGSLMRQVKDGYVCFPECMKPVQDPGSFIRNEQPPEAFDQKIHIDPNCACLMCQEVDRRTADKRAFAEQVVDLMNQPGEIKPLEPRHFTSEERKKRPLARGVLDYFPDALMEVAYTSWVGNEQHNPGQPMHWAKEKSADHADCIIRHLKDRGTLDSDKVRHSAKAAWRALALLQTEIEQEREARVKEGA